MSNLKRFSSRKEVTEFLNTKGIDTSNWSEVRWLSLNRGQSEIHMMALAECIYDAVNESTPKTLLSGEWHLPMLPQEAENLSLQEQLNWCVGIHANTSYTVIGDDKKLTLDHASKIHDKCKEEYHSSVFEHCCRAMSSEEYNEFVKGRGFKNGGGLSFYSDSQGWCNNIKGFIPYRYIIDNKINL